MQCVYFFSSNQDQGELGNLVRGLVSTQGAWYFQRATRLKTISWPRQNHCSLLSLALNIGWEVLSLKHEKITKTLPGVVGPDGACVGGEPLGAILGCLPLAITLDLAYLNVPLLGGLPGKGGQGGFSGASNLNVHWKPKSTLQGRSTQTIFTTNF